jgi:1,4-dihydroxy-2-naphthoate octaprenyltransferase
LAVPRAVKVARVFAKPKPTERPANFPIWPLWFVAWAFVFTRLAGVLLIAGLLVQAIYPISL